MNIMSMKSNILWLLVLLPILVVQIPGVLIFQHVTEPRLFGVPFIYWFAFLCWVVQLIFVAIACINNWGEDKVKDEKKEAVH